MKIKDWKSAKADKAWKVFICARDYTTADECLGHMACILCDMSKGREANLELIKQMSGKQIVEGLIAYRDKSLKSIENGLNNKEEEKENVTMDQISTEMAEAHVAMDLADAGTSPDATNPEATLEAFVQWEEDVGGSEAGVNEGDLPPF